MRSRGTTPRASGAGSSWAGRAVGARSVAGLVVPRVVVPRVMVAGVVVAGLALAGCSGGPTPTPSVTWTSVRESPWPTPTPTATPAPTDPAAVPPVRPAAMDEVSDAGAEAVATYFLALYGYVYATGDLTEWQALSHPDCVFCASVITHVQEQMAGGGRSEGGLIAVDSISSVDVTPGEFFTVTISATQAPWRAFDADGTKVNEQAEAQSHEFTVIVVRESDQWLVRAAEVLDESA